MSEVSVRLIVNRGRHVVFAPLSSLITAAAGKWLGLAPIPEGRTMEALEIRLQDKARFLGFIRRALPWVLEGRATAKKLLRVSWLTGEEA